MRQYLLLGETAHAEMTTTRAGARTWTSCSFSYRAAAAAADDDGGRHHHHLLFLLVVVVVARELVDVFLPFAFAFVTIHHSSARKRKPWIH